MRIFFLVNVGRRRQGPDPALLQQMRDAFRRRGVEFRMELSRSVDACHTLLTEAAREGYDSLWIGGGDGTVNHVLNSTAGRFASYAVVPMGTVNGLARALGTPRDPVEAIEWLLDGEPTGLDLGQVGDRLFVLYATVGFHAAVFHATNDRLKRAVGRAAFFAAGAVEACRVAHLPQFKIAMKKVGSVEDSCHLPGTSPEDGNSDTSCSSGRTEPKPVTDMAQVEHQAVAAVGVDWGETTGGAEMVDAGLEAAEHRLAEEEEPKLATDTMPPPSEVELVRRTGYSLVLSNLCNFSGFGAIREGDLCDSSFLQAHLFESCSLWPMLRFFAAMRYRRPRTGDPGVEHFRVSELTVRSEQPLWLQVDGEPLHLDGDREYRFVCVPKAIQIVCNREAVAASAGREAEQEAI